MDGNTGVDGEEEIRDPEDDATEESEAVEGEEVL